MTKSYSLKNRLLLLASCVLLFGFSLTAWIINSAYQFGLQASIEDKLQVQILTLVSAAEQENNHLVLPEVLADSRFNQLSSGLYAFALSGDGKEQWRSNSAVPFVFPKLNALNAGEKLFQQRVIEGEVFFIAGLGTIWETETGDVKTTFYVLESGDGFLTSSEQFKQKLWQALLVVAFILLCLQWWVLRWGLQPLKAVSKELRAVELGEQNRLNNAYPVELKQLTSSINNLLLSEQNQRQRYKDRMADLAHSLKTPLAIISGTQSKDSSAQTSEINKQVARMRNIVDYQLQRAVLGSQPLSFTKVSIANVIQQIKTALDKVYAVKNVKCELNLDEQIFFRGDESDLTEIIANLMDNAYKYGAGIVWVTLKKVDHFTQLTIEDNGNGMDEAAFQQVLTRGARLDSQQQGQGIGMAVVAELIKQYHGDLSCAESTLMGLKITVNLP